MAKWKVKKSGTPSTINLFGDKVAFPLKKESVFPLASYRPLFWVFAGDKISWFSGGTQEKMNKVAFDFAADFLDLQGQANPDEPVTGLNESQRLALLNLWQQNGVNTLWSDVNLTIGMPPHDKWVINPQSGKNFEKVSYANQIAENLLAIERGDQNVIQAISDSTGPTGWKFINSSTARNPTYFEFRGPMIFTPYNIANRPWFKENFKGEFGQFLLKLLQIDFTNNPSDLGTASTEFPIDFKLFAQFAIQYATRYEIELLTQRLDRADDTGQQFLDYVEVAYDAAKIIVTKGASFSEPGFDSVKRIFGGVFGKPVDPIPAEPGPPTQTISGIKNKPPTVDNPNIELPSQVVKGLDPNVAQSAAAAARGGGSSLVSGAAGAAQGAVGGLAGAAGGLASQAQGAVGGIGGGIQNAVGGVTGGIGNAIGGVTGGIGNAVSGVTGGIGGALSNIPGVGGAVGGLTSGIGGAVGGLTSGIGGAVGGAVNGAGGVLNNLGSGLVGGAAIGAGIGALAGKGKGALIGAAGGALAGGALDKLNPKGLTPDGLGKNWSPDKFSPESIAGNNVKIDPKTGAISNIKDKVGGLASKVGGAVSGVTGAVGGAVSGVTGGIGGALSNVPGVGGALGGAVSGVGGAVGGLTSGIGGAAGNLVGNVGASLTPGGGGLGGIVSSVGGAVSGVGGAIGSSVGGVAGSATGAVKSIPGLGNPVGNLVSGAGGAVSNVVGGISGGVGGGLGKVGSGLSGTTSAATAVATAKLDSAKSTLASVQSDMPVPKVPQAASSPRIKTVEIKKPEPKVEKPTKPIDQQEKEEFEKLKTLATQYIADYISTYEKTKAMGLPDPISAYFKSTYSKDFKRKLGTNVKRYTSEDEKLNPWYTYYGGIWDKYLAQRWTWEKLSNDIRSSGKTKKILEELLKNLGYSKVEKLKNNAEEVPLPQ